MPFMNCSFSLLSFSLHPSSFAFILSQPIHSLPLSVYSVVILQYYYGDIISLCGSLNFTLITSNSPGLVLHFSFSSSFRICINLRLSQPNQFIIIGTFSLFVCCNYWSWYLSGIFQFNVCCFKVGPPILGAVFISLALLIGVSGPLHYHCFGGLSCCLCYALFRCHYFLFPMKLPYMGLAGIYLVICLM